ncbi:MAG: acyl-CoA dehydrogenase family protein [Chromatiales bacterium]
MTERQGGSDLRANTTRAHPLGATGPGGEYTLIGHKWFCSAPMSDAFLVLARISHQCVDTWAKGIDEDIRKEDRLN